MKDKPIIMGIGGSYAQTCDQIIKVVGGESFLLPAETDDEFLKETYDISDSILLLGGGDIDADYYGAANSFNWGLNPRRDKVELALVNAAMRDGKPLLGLCRGIQVMAVAAGGTLFQHVQDHWLPSGRPSPRYEGFALGEMSYRQEHPLQVAPKSRLRRILGDLVGKDGEVWVNSMHHQAVQTLAGGFKTSAWNEIIEAIEHDDGPWIGVQWHPEMMQFRSKKWLRLFRWLVKEAKKYGKER